jgi:flagellar hook-associated protein 1 FlgK
MSNLITALQTGASGIYTNQTGIQVTGNNISNANTAGYSKQTANVTSSSSLTQGSLIFGTGSTVNSVDRSGDIFITRQLVAQSAVYGEYEASSAPLGDIEQILNISETSLSGDIDSFFDAWEILSTNPAGTTERQNVIQEAKDLAAHFQQIDQQLGDVIKSISSSIESEIPDINDQLQQIADLNKTIMITEVSNGNANTLRDQRDLLVQQVSETCGASVYSDANGMTCLQLDGGLPLVTGTVASTLSIDQINGLSQITLNSGQSAFSLEGDDFGGILGGLFTVRDEVIPQYRDDIDQLAYEIATDVNALHSTGLDLNGDAAMDLFSLTAPISQAANAWQDAAASITVNFDDTALIAAGTSGQTGDNSLTLSIAELCDTTSINGSTYTEKYAVIAAGVGLLVSSNEDKLTSSTELLSSIKDKRDSACGVSSEEEMLLLIQYQSGYEAAANYISVIKEMIDQLMSI